MPPTNHQTLRSRRDQLDLSNAELAAKAGVNPDYLVNIICGVDNPSMRVIHRLSRVLKLPVEDILAKPTGDPSDPPKQPANEPKGPPTRQEREPTKGPRRARDAG